MAARTRKLTGGTLLVAFSFLPAVGDAGPFPETPEGRPVLFAPGRISTEAAEWAITFTPSLEHAYVTRRLPGEGPRILHSGWTESGWSEAGPAVFSVEGDEAPYVTEDQEHLFFSSRRPLPGGGSDDPSDNIWLLVNTPVGWDKPIPLPGYVNYPRPRGTTWPAGSQLRPFVDPRGLLYFWSAGENGSSGGDLYLSVPDAEGAGPAKPLPAPVNTRAAGERHPYLSPDGIYLLFDSLDKPNGFGGSDLFVCMRRPGGEWTRPINVGPRVNTRGHEAFASFSPDGTYFFFASDRGAERGASSIWTIAFKDLESDWDFGGRSPFLSSGPILQAQPFSPGRISGADTDERRITVAPNGRAAYVLTTDPHEISRSRLGYSEFRRGDWSLPEPMTLPGDPRLTGAALSQDGQRLIYGDGEETWVLTWDETAWSAPTPLQGRNGKAVGGEGYCLLPDGTVYFSVARDGAPGAGDLFRARLGSSEPPRALGAPVNSAAPETTPYVDPHQRFLIFTREAPAVPGFYLSTNREDAITPKWSEPRRIEALPFGRGGTFSPDGRFFLFSAGGEIYSISTRALDVGL